MKKVITILSLLSVLSACVFNIQIPSEQKHSSQSYLAPDSILYKRPQLVAKNVYSAIGATAPPTYENSGHNNNLSFIITPNGVVVINAGSSYLLAQALHNEIKKITDQKVKYVILENAQSHAMLGSNYWQEQGAKIVAQKDGAKVMKNYGKASLLRMQERQKEKAKQTKEISNIE